MIFNLVLLVSILKVHCIAHFGPDHPCCYATAPGVVYEVDILFSHIIKIWWGKKFFIILRKIIVPRGTSLKINTMTLGNFTDSNHLANSYYDAQQAQNMVNDIASQINNSGLTNPYIRATPATITPNIPDAESQKLYRMWQQTPKRFHDSKFKMENFKTPVHELLDSLFTLEEMMEYLESMDYRKIPGSSYLVKGEPDPEFKRTFTVHEAFYAEMTIKLKNTLLSKGSLKLKI